MNRSVVRLKSPPVRVVVAMAPRRLLVVLVAGLLLGATAGCAHTIPLRGALGASPTGVQVPVTVGVYYSPEFKAREERIWRMGDRWDFPLGAASVALLDQAWPIMFEQPVPVSGRPPLGEGSPKVAAVIEPRIEAFDFGLPFLKTGTYTAEITYRMTLYAPDGTSLASWTVRGAGARPGEMGFDFAGGPGRATDLAMQDAAAKLIGGFRDIPEVRRWLRQIGAPGASRSFPWLRAARERG